ncbi:hypothetical protein HPT27_01865 [Permianibacter sp. IMCC34836]|uniref:hypothetical protein n=1 Tax=Permianibacter fluminis TaxID=2738515 RepID=UPI0015565234|nr:hypothetical protein [Permianibacter fluminis]NQD35749.1 hypothetical protein [Permianibacter fluminis]
MWHSSSALRIVLCCTVAARCIVGNATEVCESSVGAFVNAFANSASVQAAAIPESVEFGRLNEDETGSGFTLDVKVWPKDEIKLFESGWFPTKDERERLGLTFETVQENDDVIVVKLEKSDTDYLIRYLFQRKRSCYVLTGINNESL